MIREVDDVKKLQVFRITPENVPKFRVFINLLNYSPYSIIIKRSYFGNLMT